MPGLATAQIPSQLQPPCTMHTLTEHTRKGMLSSSVDAGLLMQRHRAAVVTRIALQAMLLLFIREVHLVKFSLRMTSRRSHRLIALC